MTWLRNLGSQVWAGIALVVLFLGAAAQHARLIRKSERLTQDNAAHRGAAEANRRMNDADIGAGDPDADLDWLRRRADRDRQ